MELIIVLVVALLVLGPKRLPEVGKSLGNGIREFKDSLSGDNNRPDDAHVDLEEPPKAVTATAATAPAPPAEPAATTAAPAAPEHTDDPAS
jgi:sec-independent protein translocase protein TatA